MNKREAHVIAAQVGSLFNNHFKNAYRVLPGKQWKQIAPRDAAQIAQESIIANCQAVKTTDSKVGTFTWRVVVEAKEPKFVEPLFYIDHIDNELQNLFHLNLMRVTSQVDLRNNTLTLSYKGRDTTQYYHFNFRLR